jgi:hypothetical protein
MLLIRATLLTAGAKLLRSISFDSCFALRATWFPRDRFQQVADIILLKEKDIQNETCCFDVCCARARDQHRIRRLPDRV